MYSLLLLSYLAVLAPVLAAPGAQYSSATSTLAPTSTTNVVSYPTPTLTPTSTSATLPLPPNIEELKRREPAVPAVFFGKRQSSCSYGTFACSDGSGCCKNGELCYGSGYCYNPSESIDPQISSLLAEYSAATNYDYGSALSFFDAMTNTGSPTKSTYQTNTNTNHNGNTINVGSGGEGTPKKKSNTGMIAGIIVAVAVLAIAAIVIFFFVRRNKQKKEAAAAVQQPFVSQNPQPLINTTTPGPYPPTPGPYPGPYPPTPGPYPPTPAPYSPAPYPPAPEPYTPAPAPYDPYGGVNDKDKVPYYNNQPVPPNTVEMPANQTPIGPRGQHYQPPAAGIVEAGGESVYRPPSTTGHPPGQPPPNQGGTVYEMDSRQYGQQ